MDGRRVFIIVFPGSPPRAVLMQFCTCSEPTCFSRSWLVAGERQFWSVNADGVLEYFDLDTGREGKGHETTETHRRI